MFILNGIFFRVKVPFNACETWPLSHSRQRTKNASCHCHSLLTHTHYRATLHSFIHLTYRSKVYVFLLPFKPVFKYRGTIASWRRPWNLCNMRRLANNRR